MIVKKFKALQEANKFLLRMANLFPERKIAMRRINGNWNVFVLATGQI